MTHIYILEWLICTIRNEITWEFSIQTRKCILFKNLNIGLFEIEKIRIGIECEKKEIDKKTNKIENDGRDATRETNCVSNAVEEGMRCRRIEFEFTTRKDLGYIFEDGVA